MRRALIAAMREVFGDDERRISHALAVLDWAGKIHVTEGGNRKVVIAASILHDIGIHEAEKLEGSSAGIYQEKYGPTIAKEILQKQGYSKELIGHVCEIVANHHSDGGIDTPEFRAVWDADWIVNIGDDFADAGAEKIERLIERNFKTEAGKRLASEEYLVD